VRARKNLSETELQLAFNAIRDLIRNGFSQKAGLKSNGFFIERE
jgi:hypothetical protein